jgi:hypothetical protein
MQFRSDGFVALAILKQVSCRNIPVTLVDDHERGASVSPTTVLLRIANNPRVVVENRRSCVTVSLMFTPLVAGPLRSGRSRMREPIAAHILRSRF